MSELQQLVAEVLERRGAAVEVPGADQLEVLAPAALQQQFGWPELVRLGFGTQRADGTIAIALEGDWLERFGALLGEDGRWSEREVRLSSTIPPPSDPERLLDLALNLPNAVWRLQGVSATWTRLLMLTFRYTALSDETRDALISIGFNLATGAVVNDILARLKPVLAQMPDWRVPDAASAVEPSERTIPARGHRPESIDIGGPGRRLHDGAAPALCADRAPCPNRRAAARR